MQNTEGFGQSLGFKPQVSHAARDDEAHVAVVQIRWRGWCRNDDGG